jgi:DNA polymerase I-like protein with 3'-5' exonuclease and polymerase domains
MEGEEYDPLNELVGSIIAATVEKTAKLLGKETEVDELKEQVLQECYSEQSSDSQVQDLKTKLYEWMQNEREYIIDDVMEEVRNSLKLELRMQLHSEMDAMIAEKLEKLNVTGMKKIPVNPTPREYTTGTFSTFDTELSSVGLGIETPMGGFESVAKHFTFGSQRSTESVEEKLMSNPLFARVNTSLARQQKGEAAYNIDDLVEIRRQRGMDEDEEKQFRGRIELSNFDYDEEDPEEADRFERLMREKCGF